MKKWLLAAMALLLIAPGAYALPLGELPLLTDAAALPEPSGAVEILLAGDALPCDPELRLCLYPEGTDAASQLHIEPAPGWEYAVLFTEEGYTVYGFSGSSCAATQLVPTALPVLDLTTADAQLPTEADSRGQLRIFTAEGANIHLESTPIEINLRGNTSQRYPKKSYRVKTIYENGEKRNLSIAGLRSDDDWILNPMYSDTSKIREKLGYELWAMMNSSGTTAQSSRLEYAEVYLNGRYWGLYGVQERIDRKQVDADKRSGVLYKVFANDRPTPAELLACESDALCRGIELEFAGGSILRPWDPASAYMALLSGENSAVRAALDMENLVDYGLWAMLAQAHDCHFKNQFLHCVYNGGGHTIYKIPWDLNNTFGDVWENDAEATNYTEFRIASLVMDGAFEVYMDSGDPAFIALVQRRWQQLRDGGIDAERLIARAKQIHAEIYPAIQRDTLRWPECGMGEGNAANILDIEDYLRRNIARIDEYIQQLAQE